MQRRNVAFLPDPDGLLVLWEDVQREMKDKNVQIEALQDSVTFWRTVTEETENQNQVLYKENQKLQNKNTSLVSEVDHLREKLDAMPCGLTRGDGIDIRGDAKSIEAVKQALHYVVEWEKTAKSYAILNTNLQAELDKIVLELKEKEKTIQDWRNSYNELNINSSKKIVDLREKIKELEVEIQDLQCDNDDWEEAYEMSEKSADQWNKIAIQRMDEIRSLEATLDELKKKFDRQNEALSVLREVINTSE